MKNKNNKMYGKGVKLYSHNCKLLSCNSQFNSDREIDLFCSIECRRIQEKLDVAKYQKEKYKRFQNIKLKALSKLKIIDAKLYEILSLRGNGFISIKKLEEYEKVV